VGKKLNGKSQFRTFMGQETQILDGEVAAHFIQRINPNTPIYRIFTLERGLAAVIGKKLTLTRPSLWDDPYENALYNRKVENPEGQLVSIEALRNSLYAQCWTEDGNSDALWRIYSPSKNGVRATTTVGKLLKAISENNGIRKAHCFIGKVNYCHQEIMDELFSRIEFSDLTDTSGIVLPENWTGGLDGESEGTIIPSREIYETTT
jgi:hypothetical protein